MERSAVLASAALKTGLAGWIAVTRWAFGSHRVSELGGWARRAPLLGVTYAVLLVGSVGFPGLAIFEARIGLIDLALPGWLGTIVVLVATLGPLLGLGRLLATGLRTQSMVVQGAPDVRVGRLVTTLGGWSRGGPIWWLRTAGSVIRANVGLGVGIAALVLGVLGFAIALVGAGAVPGPGA